MQAYYSYAISVHHHGQVKDTHRRLTGDASLFRLPLDTEVSERYLMGCLESARQYRGPEGEVRKIHTIGHPSRLKRHTINCKFSHFSLSPSLFSPQLCSASHEPAHSLESGDVMPAVAELDQDSKGNIARRRCYRLGNWHRVASEVVQVAIYTVNSRAGTQTLHRQFLV